MDSSGTKKLWSKKAAQGRLFLTKSDIVKAYDNPFTCFAKLDFKLEALFL